ncbi:MAG: S46 family peptidase [Thermoanaerobaculia bacterium]
MRKIAVLILAFAALPLFAGEGMWMPQQIPQVAAELKKLGIEMDPNKLADLTGDPMGAVISLGGCTASFVSPDGLIVTNHHCAFGAIQLNSTPERDLITNGFLAKTREEELNAPGTRVWVTTKIEDVTAELNKVFKPKMTDADRAKALDLREKELISDCEKPGGLRCRVASFFEGSKYLRMTQAEITDVRLVYAPARMVGEFGGDDDNFEWPRHTGDFSFYRAYVDGKPYKPQHWLKVAKEDVDEGDLVIVAGYPGRTYRYRTADEVRNSKEFVYPTSIRYFTDVIAILEAQGKGNRAVQIKNSGRIKGLNNSLKNFTSVNEGFTKDRILENKIASEVKLREMIAATPSMSKYAATLDEIARLNAEEFKTRERDTIVGWLAGRGSTLMAQAGTINRLATERTKKKDLERRSGFQEREWPRMLQGSERAQRAFDLGTDRAVFTYFLNESQKLPAGLRIKPLDDAVTAAGGVDQFVEQLYANTKVATQEERAKMYAETPAQLKARNDSMLNLSASLQQLADANEARELAYRGAMTRLRPGYFEALKMAAGRELYPDANSTLRITFGTIQGYTPRDATSYTPQTTLRGVVEKETGKDPFASPKALLAAAADPAKTAPYVDPEIKDVPVNFLSSCDTTGGNSGSPTLNGKGELIGLLFDGNYESIDSDFQYNEAVSRSIHVDAQYMLWVMDAVDGADNLILELGLEPKVN